MEFTVQQISDLLNGNVEGNAAFRIRNLSKIEEAKEGDVTFLANPKYEHHLYLTHASAVIISHNFTPKGQVSSALIRVDDPYLAFSRLLEEYQRAVISMRNGVEQPCFLGHDSTIGDSHYRGAFSYIGNRCRIGDNVKIFPQVYIGDNVRIGNNTILYPGVKIYNDTEIGNHCTIHAGAIIGSDGFGFAPQKDGTYKDIPQIGNVVIEDHVNIGANSTIDCATMGSTIIRAGTKIDNLVQIAHNVEIGAHTVIAAQSAIAGSSKIGSHCVIAGQVGVVGHITIANRTTIGAQSGVSKSVKKEGAIIQGSPAFDYKENLRAITVFRKLPEIQKLIDELKVKK
jgi:UDP-3-O-[3-hydroxymyristoyl] glucosamine N-acyltransferase